MTQSARVFLVAALAAFTSAMVSDHVPQLPELSKGAQAIFVGTVVGQQSHWDARHRLILTETRFSVENWLKGGRGTAFTVTEVGGTVDGTTLQNPGQALYRDGNRYLVFGVTRETGGVRTYWGPFGRATVDGDRVDLRAQAPEAPLQPLPDVLGEIRVQAGVRP